LLIAACGGSDPETAAEPAEAAAEQQSGSGMYVLTADDLSKITVRSAYDAIRRLRPSWLTGRRGDPLVVLDGVTMSGGSGVLRNSNVENIAEIRYMTPNDGRIRYGARGEAGVIMVTTKR
jgi:hypothetical protein